MDAPTYETIQTQLERAKAIAAELRRRAARADEIAAILEAQLAAGGERA